MIEMHTEHLRITDTSKRLIDDGKCSRAAVIAMEGAKDLLRSARALDWLLGKLSGEGREKLMNEEVKGLIAAIACYPGDDLDSKTNERFRWVPEFIKFYIAAHGHAPRVKFDGSAGDWARQMITLSEAKVEPWIEGLHLGVDGEMPEFVGLAMADRVDVIVGRTDVFSDGGEGNANHALERRPEQPEPPGV